MDVENPASGGLAGRVARASARDVGDAVASARSAQAAWALVPVAERAALLLRLADLLERDRERLAHIITAELGKPIVESRGEVGGAAEFCRYFASAIRVSAGEIVPPSTATRETLIRREPIGVVAGIIPWNYPLALTARKVAPAVAAGNAIVLKPSELTPMSALAFAELAVEAGMPAGLLSVLPGTGGDVGTALVQADVDFVTMTGSVRAGRSILVNASDRILPVSLELGGNAPFIVFDDADLEAAAESAVHMRMMNCGQACVCNERTYVHESVFDEFVQLVKDRVEALRLGDPLDDSTAIGPKASAGELENVARIVEESVAGGAEVVAGAERATVEGFESGHWYLPTLLVDRGSDSPAVREEIFGPVLPLTPFRDERDVVARANDTEFGLSSYLYTADFRRVMRLTGALRAAEVFVNRSGPEEVSGFHGGWGLSGLGGDDGTHGLDLFRRKKTVYLDWSEGSTADTEGSLGT